MTTANPHRLTPVPAPDPCDVLTELTELADVADLLRQHVEVLRFRLADRPTVTAHLTLAHRWAADLRRSLHSAAGTLDATTACGPPSAGLERREVS
ncbi:hypothetical protein Q5425_33845 [Amycolatopsis sp. A133]|uniref:hypothetical protein n=1 Tax=Amycolatopsis sp. A133 TaxID=3064472 RepID=UPI0027F5EA08|nr:hypothetical protein [Amycolatopsis sp. A133]MDQ7808745.1 hypothetical protein [Amycolatopsis sp. A133]